MLCVFLILFAYLPLLFFVFSTRMLVLSFSCGGRFNVCRLFASVLIRCCGGVRVGMVGWERDRRKDVGEKYVMLFCVNPV
jgi:hypothetical protein